MHRQSLVFFAIVSIFISAIATAQELTTYPQLPRGAQAALFDESIPDTVDTVAAIDIKVLGSIDASNACSGAVLQQLAQLQSNATPLKNGQMLQVMLVASTPTVLTQIVTGQANAVKNSGAASFVMIYRVVTDPQSLVDMAVHPLQTAQCMLGQVSEATVGTIEIGAQTGNWQQVSEGATTLLVTLVTVGSGAESAVNGLGKLGTAGNFGARVGQQLEGILNQLGGPVRNGSALAWQPALAWSIPVTRVAAPAIATATAAAGGGGMGIMLMSKQHAADASVGEWDKQYPPADEAQVIAEANRHNYVGSTLVPEEGPFSNGRSEITLKVGDELDFDIIPRGFKEGQPRFTMSCERVLDVVESTDGDVHIYTAKVRAEVTGWDGLQRFLTSRANDNVRVAIHHIKEALVEGKLTTNPLRRSDAYVGIGHRRYNYGAWEHFNDAPVQGYYRYEFNWSEWASGGDF